MSLNGKGFTHKQAAKHGKISSPEPPPHLLGIGGICNSTSRFAGSFVTLSNEGWKFQGIMSFDVGVKGLKFLKA